jgi:hypothetical protein
MASLGGSSVGPGSKYGKAGGGGGSGVGAGGMARGKGANYVSPYGQRVSRNTQDN